MDAPLVGTVQDGGQPLQVEDAVLGLPGRPGRLTDSDDREVGRGHEVEVLLEPGRGLVLVVVRSAEEDGLGKFAHGGLRSFLFVHMDVTA